MKTIFRTTAAVLAVTAAMAVGGGITAPTAAAQEAVGSSEVMGSLSELVTGVVTTGSGPALLTGSNEAATATGSSELAGALICGLLSVSSNGRPSICTTGPLG
ncbi:hypothetical protein [Nocardia salmonicida]|uniref:hypothetical protein n=1 Tax=Nocardia salmonicida TaxID=53431 RepID=UPI0007A4AF30|nr:hypothetical protein [Nocardia salmonicida]